jgi:hypothetical protein
MNFACPLTFEMIKSTSIFAYPLFPLHPYNLITPMSEHNFITLLDFILQVFKGSPREV